MKEQKQVSRHQTKKMEKKSICKPILIDKPNTDDWYVKIVGMLQQKKAQATSVLTANTFAFTSSV